MADTAVVKAKKIKVKNSMSMGEHLKHQNVFFYLSALCSVALIALLFVPWIKSFSILGLILKSTKFFDLCVFLVPVTALFVIFQLIYLITMFRPGHQGTYLGTPMMLAAGLEMLVFLFASDALFKVVTASEATGFLDFFAKSGWTWTPLIWFVLALLQKWIFAKFAYGKKVVQ